MSRKRHKSAGRNSEQSDSSMDSDSDESDVEDYMYRTLPTATSEWDILCLQSIDIHYHNHFHNLPSDILDIVHAKTGMFGPLTEKQEEFTKNLQNSISFSCSITEIIGIDLDLNVETFIPEMEKDIEKNGSSSSDPLTEVSTVVDDFINSTIIMMKYQSSYLKMIHKYGKQSIPPVSKDIFADIFKAFTKMCCLLPVPGSAWRSIMNIHQVDVTSTPDVVIMTKDHLHSQFPETSSVVSIAELKNLGVFTNDDDDENNDEERTTRTHRNTSSDSSELKEADDSEPSVHEKPAILKRVGQKVLGQHGGELLLHQSLYRQTLDKEQGMRYIPGMIVIGTEVTFTLLELHGKHLAELRSKDGNIRHKSYIYYSKPRNLLKKEDRDILLESFVRLNNKK
ncbi:uncharacterized protein LOC127724369 isoform X3 [Mytilus californianus]|uniref:uncharacterized protein LOC127724369 isoform X3 n=1 Tax=Mytilus californianus TaxID=6549 RepID=UPI00224625FA|nr:uncharacterized protein LOC127724369 isoform X3 [Mytilus californianus]